MKAAEGAIIDVFRTDEPVIDKVTWVLNERDDWTGYYSIIATDERDGGTFSQFCSGFYESNGLNPHLGERPRYLPERLLDHVLGRLTEGE